MLDHFGVTKEGWQDAVARDPNFAESETPHFLERALAHLAADPHRHRFNAHTLASWTLMDEYGFTAVTCSGPLPCCLCQGPFRCLFLFPAFRKRPS